jgi:hypothetical protein
MIWLHALKSSEGGQGVSLVPPHKRGSVSPLSPLCPGLFRGQRAPPNRSPNDRLSPHCQQLGPDQIILRNFLEFPFRNPEHSAVIPRNIPVNAQMHADKRRYKRLKRFNSGKFSTKYPNPRNIPVFLNCLQRNSGIFGQALLCLSN